MVCQHVNMRTFSQKYHFIFITHTAKNQMPLYLDTTYK